MGWPFKVPPPADGCEPAPKVPTGRLRRGGVRCSSSRACPAHEGHLIDALVRPPTVLRPASKGSVRRARRVCQASKERPTVTCSLGERSPSCEPGQDLGLVVQGAAHRFANVVSVRTSTACAASVAGSLPAATWPERICGRPTGSSTSFRPPGCCPSGREARSSGRASRRR